MNIKKTKRPPQITFEASSELIDALKEIKRVTQTSQSDVIREATWEKIARIKASHPAFQTSVPAVETSN